MPVLSFSILKITGRSGQRQLPAHHATAFQYRDTILTIAVYFPP